MRGAVIAVLCGLLLLPAVARAGDAPALMDEKGMKAVIPDASQEIGLQAFLALQKKAGTIVIDLREQQYFAQQHIAGSVNVPLTELTGKTLSAVVPDKTAGIVLVCDNSFFPTRRVAMTLQAYPVLAAEGYAHIYRLNLWQGADNHMLARQDIEKFVKFEGASVPPAPDAHVRQIMPENK